MNEVRLNSAPTTSVPGTASSAGVGDNQKRAAATASSQSTAEVTIAEVRRQAEQAASAEAVTQAVADLNAYLQNEQRDLRFSVDDGSGEMVVRVVDRESGELIRQIPNEITLALAARARQDEPLQLVNLQG